MKNHLLSSAAFFAPPDNPGGGGGQQQPAGGGQQQQPAGGDGQQQPAGGGQQQPAGGGQQQPGGGDGGSAPYRPAGLPDTMFGANDRETMDKLATALNGYRTRDGSRGALPEKPDGYKLEWGEPLKPYMAQLSSDEFGTKFLGKVTAAAHKHGLGDKQFNGFLNDVLGEMVTGEMVEPIVDPKKERAALLPDSAKALSAPEQAAAIDKRLNDNLAWIDAMKTQGMPKEAADFLVTQLGDRAHGVIGMEWIRSKIGGGAQPHAGGNQAGADRVAAVRARETAPETNSSHPNHKTFIAETQRLYQELDRDGLTPPPSGARG